ncbi:4,5-DOPA dioxygenase extradiol [Halobacteriovorax sp. GB3]|uniref:4,5-DOPA-extradiol-dioxygenase n=1 Tax=Halobacteriovorax sp. GB3 TaxID=2719615 RepID=UPI0023603536|nr:4,5-DOPA dioxygenase extradiol [Halobacteriovorax sp. GB3]MDD0851657.1 4,5-DOPA dioxygenase extradiol [Halobacteriovorax sp. GB3]
MKKFSRRSALAAGVFTLATMAFWRKKEMNKKKKMPVLFLGHGSPMNAISNNTFTQKLEEIGQIVEKPKAILIISAHWETRGSWVTGMEWPKTIHDFYGFPKELYEVQYVAPGSPEMANEIAKKINDPRINVDQKEWGLDHGTWSVLKFLYPKADVPIVQLSLDATKPMSYHFELGKKLKFLREQGVLIVGSGNIVHNLRQINFDKEARPHDWAIEFDNWVKEKLTRRDFKPLYENALDTQAGRLSIPSIEHYTPLLYILGASDQSDKLTFDYEGIESASLSMRCVRFGV